MPVYLDVESRLNRGSLDVAAREIRSVFDALGKDVSKGLSRSFSGFSTSEARRELQAMQLEYRKLADAELEAARVATRSAREVEVAQRRAAEVTAKYTAESSQAARAQAMLADAQAKAARDMRVNADAIVASEAAHKRLGSASTDAAGATAAAARVWNGVGIASVLGFGAALTETTKVAGNFQASQTRLMTSAGESAQNLKVVSDGILKLAGQVGYSAQDLSNAMYTVESAGIRGSDGINVLKAAAQGAKSENADLKEVLSGLTTTLTDFYPEAQRSGAAADVMSKMITAVGESKTTFQDFASALHSVEPAAAAAHMGLSDVYGSLAQITQSGTSPDQAAQNMAHAIQTLSKPSQQMRDEMGQFGLNAVDVSQKLGERGLAGTVQYLSNTIREHMSPQGQVIVDTMYKSEQATQSAQQIFDHLPPAAKRVAEAIRDGSLSYKEFRKSRGGLDVEQANELQQWVNLNNKVSGYSQALKSGQGDVQTYLQALSLMVGGQDSARIALQLSGENADAANEKIRKINDTTRETDGTVKGFNETQQTLNAKMADAKAAFGAAAIEVGTAFIPIMTDVANVAKTVGDEMAKHPGITRGVVEALGILGGAWLTFKAINIVGSILSPIATSLGTIVAEEDAAAASAGGLGAALKGLAGPVAIGAAVGLPIAQATTHSDWFRNIESQNPLGHNPVSEFINRNTPSWLGGDIVDSHGDVTRHASGGAVHGHGPSGIDSVPALLAPGEHVLTHHDVAKMGGHSGVYAFRQALQGGVAIHRSVGGEVPGGPSGGGGGTVPLVQNPDGTWTSPNPAWAHLIRRESSGINQRQGIIDANSGGNEAEGLFQITPATWRGHGGAAFASNPLAATPQQQAQIAARILQGNPSGSDWGAGLPGRESASALLSGLGGAANLPKGSQSDPVYVSMSPNGATPGRGPLGQPGYYTQSPERVSAAEERLRHLDEEIRIAEERKNNMKADASQAEKDRLNEEIRHLHQEREQAQERLGKAKQGNFHTGGGGRGGGMGGSPFMPVPLADKFGLDKGLPGLAEWAVGFLEDLVLGPMETAAMAGLYGGGDMGMLPGPGDAGFGAPGPDAMGGSAEGPSGGYKTASGTPGSGGSGGRGPGWNDSSGFAQSSAGSPFSGRSSGTRTLGPPTKGVDPRWVSPLPGNFPAGPIIGGDPRWQAPHFATGGPSGSDTIPAWLSPGEFVVNANATNQFLPSLQAMNAQYFDDGSTGPITPQPQNAAAPKPPAPPPAPKPPPPPPGPGAQPGAQQAPGGPVQPGGEGVDIHQDRSNLATPGQDIHELGSDLGAQPGIGFSGGIIGAAESAASSAGSMFPGGGAAGAAMQVGFQELNRAAAYGAQVASIGVEGVLESIIPGGSGGADWSKTIPGRVLLGVAGVRPTQNTAGQTQTPMQGGGQPDQQYSGMGVQGPTSGGVQIGHVDVHANDAGQMMDSLNHQATMAGNAYPTSGNVTGPGGGR